MMPEESPEILCLQFEIFYMNFNLRHRVKEEEYTAQDERSQIKGIYPSRANEHQNMFYGIQYIEPALPVRGFKFTSVHK